MNNDRARSRSRRLRIRPVREQNAISFMRMLLYTTATQTTPEEDALFMRAILRDIRVLDALMAPPAPRVCNWPALRNAVRMFAIDEVFAREELVETMREYDKLTR